LAGRKPWRCEGVLSVDRYEGEDALRVLGVGVSYDANQTAIKKVVDGLRMSWHPDHAEGEDDRRVRELRLKQINVAWEIVSEARAEESA
jgi:DnaJ-class molecular chaperone